MTKLENPVRMATIGAAHGVRGEVRVKTFTGDPMALGDYGPLRDENGRAYTVAALRPAKTVLVVRFREIASREAAEAAAGTALYVERAALPDDLEEDEFYHADLIGLAVRDETGGKTVMVPFTLAAIPEIAVKAGFVRIDSVAAGLAGEDEAGDDEAGDEGE
jgi:16S rRNA processing protein RimM